MNPGRLIDRITIQPRTTTFDSFGVGEAWTPLVSCTKRWGRVIPLRAFEVLKWQQANAQVSHRVIFRRGGADGLVPETDRLVWKGKVLTLTSIARLIGGNEDFVEYMVLQTDEGMSDKPPIS